MTSLFQILLLLINAVWFLVIIQVVMSWLINFEVLNLRQPLVYQIWSGMNRLLEPIYQPIRNALPSTGGLDLAPLVLLLGLTVLRIVIINNMYSFG